MKKLFKRWRVWRALRQARHGYGSLAHGSVARHHRLDAFNTYSHANRTPHDH